LYQILQKQQDAMSDQTKFDLVKKGRDKAHQGSKLLSVGDLDSFGNLLHEAWMDKKQLVKEISDDYFDNIYNSMIKAGALGGKLLGAGGGGFFIFYVQENIKDKVLKALEKFPDCQRFFFRFTDTGTEILKFSQAV